MLMFSEGLSAAHHVHRRQQQRPLLLSSTFWNGRTCATSCRVNCKLSDTVGVQRAREVVQASFRAVVDGAAAPLEACLALARDAEPVPPSLSSSARSQSVLALRRLVLHAILHCSMPTYWEPLP